MSEWTINEVKNGFILTKREGYRQNEVHSYEETFVFNSAIELANWIHINFKQDRDKEHTEK